MASAKNNYEDIRGQYHDFRRPAVKISADGQNLTEDLQCRIHSVSVRLSLGNPSGAWFDLVDCYDLEGHKVKNQLISKLLPGTGVEISMGYGSSLSTVFSGYIDCVEVEFSEEAHILRVTASDVCKLMQDNGARRRIIHAETHSEAFLEIMKDYAGFCSARADDTGIELVNGLFQEESDYDFVAKRLVMETGYGYEFLVEQGTAYFRKRNPKKSPLITLSPKQGIRKLKLGLCYVNRDLQILGYSLEQGVLSAQDTAAPAHVSSSAAKGTEIVKAPWVSAQEDAGAVAASYGAYLIQNSLKGLITTVGLPLLLPGNYITVKEVDPDVDGNHYITGAEHVLGDEGYRTEIEVN